MTKKRRLTIITSSSVILALAILFILTLKQSYMASNERQASAALKTLSTAEADFRSNDRDHNGIVDFWTGDVSSLYSLLENGRPIALIARDVAEADAAPLRPLVPKPVAYHGYYFVAMERDRSTTPPTPYKQATDKTMGPVHSTARYGFCAYPESYGTTGRLSFIINEGNTMFKEDRGGKPFDGWPPESEMKVPFTRVD